MQPATRVAVVVTFLRMEQPGPPPPPLPPDTALVRLAACSVPFYRYLYEEVGGAYMWWLRRSLSDAMLSAILRDPAVSIHVLYRGGEPAGFFELEARPDGVVNLSYFGLTPAATGQRIGSAFLGAALSAAWAMGAKAVTVNTCTADHPRALPGYVRAGFQPVRSVRELWDVPNRLGMSIPAHLRA